MCCSVSFNLERFFTNVTNWSVSAKTLQVENGLVRKDTAMLYQDITSGASFFKCKVNTSLNCPIPESLYSLRKKYYSLKRFVNAQSLKSQYHFPRLWDPRICYHFLFHPFLCCVLYHLFLYPATVTKSSTETTTITTRGWSCVRHFWNRNKSIFHTLDQSQVWGKTQT